MTEHRFTARIERNGDMDAAYVVVPVNIRECYGKGRLKVEATFNMGVTDDKGRVSYIIGVTKAIRQKIGKTFGDTVSVTLRPSSK